MHCCIYLVCTKDFNVLMVYFPINDFDYWTLHNWNNESSIQTYLIVIKKQISFWVSLCQNGIKLFSKEIVFSISFNYIVHFFISLWKNGQIKSPLRLIFFHSNRGRTRCIYWFFGNNLDLQSNYKSNLNPECQFIYFLNWIILKFVKYAFSFFYFPFILLDIL